MKYRVQNYSMCIERMRESYVGLGEIALKATGNAWDSGGLWEGNSGLGGEVAVEERGLLWNRLAGWRGAERGEFWEWAGGPGKHEV